MLTPAMAAASIAVMALVTFLTRALPPSPSSTCGNTITCCPFSAARCYIWYWCRRCSKTPPHIWARLACRTHFFIFCRKKPDISPRYRNFSIMERNFFVFLFSRRICR